MQLYTEILKSVLEKEEIQIVFPNLHIDAAAIVEQECYKALCQIKGILADERLDDKICFEKIEEIVSVFERMGSNAGSRHDF